MSCASSSSSPPPPPPSEPPLYLRKDDETRGRHLVASRFIPRSTLIFVERPLLSLQSIGNSSRGALVCRRCRCFVGGPDLALGLASGRVGREEVVDVWRKLYGRGVGGSGGGEEEEEVPEGHDLVPCRRGCGEVYCSTDCESSTWRTGGHRLLCTGSIPDPPSSPPPPSSSDVGGREEEEEEFEEEDPADDDDGVGTTTVARVVDDGEDDGGGSAGGRRVAAAAAEEGEKDPDRSPLRKADDRDVRDDDDDGDGADVLHPLLRFKIHAVRTNEILLLVADLVASVLSVRHDQLLREAHWRAEEDEEEVDDGGDDGDCDGLAELMGPYLDFTMTPWWTVATESLPSEEASALDAALRRICEESSSLLREALLLQTEHDDDEKGKTGDEGLGPHDDDDEIDPHLLLRAVDECQSRYGLLASDFFGKVIGSFEQNAIGIRARHPLCRTIFDRGLRMRCHEDLAGCMERAGMIEGGGGCYGDEEGDEEEGGDGGAGEGSNKEDGPADATSSSKQEGCEGGGGSAKGEATSDREESDCTVDDVAAFLAELEIDEENDGPPRRRRANDVPNDDVDDCGDEGDDLDGLFPPLDGTAMYSIACKMNHSCEPNVVARYRTPRVGGNGASSGWGKDYPLAVQCVAMRDVREGEELCISYVKSDDALEDRRESISNYGFVCRCEKCLSEEEAAGKGGGETDETTTTRDGEDVNELFGNDSDDDEEDKVDGPFGGDDDDDEAGGGKDAPIDDDGNDESRIGATDDDDDDGRSDSPGEALLRRKLSSLNDGLNRSTLGSIPIRAFAEASSYVVQGGPIDGDAQIDDNQRDDADRDNNTTEEGPPPFVTEAHRLRRLCAAAASRRDFVRCATAGTRGERASLDALLLLRRRRGRPGGTSSTTEDASSLVRDAHGQCAIAAALGLAHDGAFLPALRRLDRATSIGVPRDRIGRFFGYVERLASELVDDGSLGRRIRRCDSGGVARLGDYRSDRLRTAVERDGPSRPIRSPMEETEASEVVNIDEFRDRYVATSRPLLIRKFANDWPAIERWRDLDEFVARHGHRVVPVELGSMMETRGMEERFMSIKEFATSYLLPSCRREVWSLTPPETDGGGDDGDDDGEGDDLAGGRRRATAYLAQHPLLSQIPTLLDDVPRRPEVCGRAGPTLVNAWIGTGGTRTPLHFDAYDNLFVQVAGAKYVRIYDRKETSKLLLVARTTTATKSDDDDEDGRSSYGAQGNMSGVDCEREDFDGRDASARDAEFVEALMLPGDGLFIPARSWHYVRSLSTSISLNYWF